MFYCEELWGGWITAIEPELIIQTNRNKKNIFAHTSKLPLTSPMTGHTSNTKNISLNWYKNELAYFFEKYFQWMCFYQCVACHFFLPEMISRNHSTSVSFIEMCLQHMNRSTLIGWNLTSLKSKHRRIKGFGYIWKFKWNHCILNLTSYYAWYLSLSELFPERTQWKFWNRFYYFVNFETTPMTSAKLFQLSKIPSKLRLG